MLTEVALRTIEQENEELRLAVGVMGQYLLGQIETGGDITAIKRIAVFGTPVARVARNGGGYLEAFEATEKRLEELDRHLELKLARAGFGPEERLALLPQVRSRLFGRVTQEMLRPTHQERLPEGDN